MKTFLLAVGLLISSQSHAATECIAQMVGEAIRLSTSSLGDIQSSGNIKYTVDQSNRDESEYVVTLLELRGQSGQEGFAEVAIHVKDFKTCELKGKLRE